jgi:serine/threonine protein kinase
LQSERHVPQPSRKCFLSAIVPFCGGGTLCERLWKGLSPCAGDHMQIVDALSVTDLTQKYHLAIGIAKALRHCHDLDIVHSDLCCCNILLTPNKQSDCDVLWNVKVANTGVCPDSDSLIKRCVYLAPELRAAIPVFCESGAQSPQYHSSPFTHSSSPSSSHSPPLPSMRSPAGALPHDRIPFTKESDVYALGVTLMQLFRHTLADCAQDICKFCAEKSSCGLNVPCFPRETSSSLFPPLPVLLQTVISSCTRRDPKARPSASKIRYANNPFFCISVIEVIKTY